MSSTTDIRISVVVAREPTGSPWAPFAWRPVGALYPAPEPVGFVLLRDGPEGQLYQSGSITMELHRKEAASYLDNLAEDEPSLYVVLRQVPDGDPPLKLHLVTPSLTEALAYGESGDEVVGPVPMPQAIADLVGAFVAEHYEVEKFVKRVRQPRPDEEVELFGQEPIFERRARERRAGLKKDET